MTLPIAFDVPAWARRDFVAFDTETFLIVPGNVAPPLVCASATTRDGAGVLLGKASRGDTFDWLDFLLELLRGEAVICGANIAFDVLVTSVAAAARGVDLLPLWFDAYEADRVYDVQIAEALHAVGTGTLGRDPRTGGELRNPETGKKGRYSLSTCVDLVLGRADAKRNDEYRLRYGELDALPIAEWPEVARIYPIDDARNTLEVALAQVGRLESVRPHEWIEDRCRRCGAPSSYPGACAVARVHNVNLHDAPAQTRKALGLHLGSAWGLRADPVLVDVLLRMADEMRSVGADRYVDVGIVREDGSEDGVVLARAVAIAYGGRGTCATCGGAGRVSRVKLSEKTGKPLKTPPVQCKECLATGLDRATFAAVPVTEPTPTNPFGSVRCGRDFLVDSGDELLTDYARHLEADKISETGTYGKILRAASVAPLNPRPNPVLETGRVSYDGGAQTLPRLVSPHIAERLRAERRAGRPAPHGVRDCLVARPGWVFDSEDYEGGELVTFAESAIERVGWSDMGAALVAGKNLHAVFACDMLGIPDDEFDKRDPRHAAFRQAAKPANFGFPGGMAGLKLALQQRTQGPDTPWPGGPSRVWSDEIGGWADGYKGLRFCLLIGGAERCGVERVVEWRDRPCPPLCRRCIECAEQLREAWFGKWSEARPYLRWHAQNSESCGWVEQIYSRRVRGGARFTAEANGDFQALLADVTGRAQWRVTLEQYRRTIVRSSEHAAGPSKYEGAPSPLFGSRSILFAHDELFGEAPESIAHDVAVRKSEIMVEEFRRACPNHAAACKAEPTLMRRYFKAAKPVYVGGRLVPWEPPAD